MADQTICIDCGKPITPMATKLFEGRCTKCGTKEQAKTDPFLALQTYLFQRAQRSRNDLSVLSLPERTYYAVIALKQEFDNGGLHQYFFNHGGVNCADAEEGLRTLNELKLLELLQQAKELLFPAMAFPLDTEVRREMIPFTELRVPNAVWAVRLPEIEERFYEGSEFLEEHLHTFARDHGLVSDNAKSPT